MTQNTTEISPVVKDADVSIDRMFDIVSDISEPSVWLANFGSTNTRRTYGRSNRLHCQDGTSDGSVVQLAKELGVKPVTIYRYVSPNGELRENGKRTILNSAGTDP